MYKFTYLRSSVSSMENDIQAVVMSILLYGCTTWMLTKCIEKKFDGNCTRMLWAILNKFWKQYPTKQQLYSGHLPSISIAIQIRQTRHAGPCWRSKDKLISNVLSWITSNGWESIWQPTRTYLQQLCKDNGCSQEDLPEVMDNRDE